MKTLSKLLALILSLCLVLSLTVMAAGNSKTYEDGENTLEVFEDGTFVMVKGGADLEGNAFQLTVKGTVDKDGKMEITGLFDGDLDLTDAASEEQKAGDLATAQALYEAMNAGAEEAGEEEGVKPGTYTDGTSTMEIAEDMTFVMTTPGQNMDGAEFELTVKGTIGEDGKITITSVSDGDIDLTEMASEEQLAHDTATAEAIYAIALEESKAAGAESPLKIEEDGSFVTTAKTVNMAGDEIEVTITGKVDENGEVILESIVDGPMELVDIIDEGFKEEQIAAIKAQLDAAPAADGAAPADVELSDGGWPLSGSGDTSMDAFKTYLKAYMDCVPEMDGHEEELYGLIDAESWEAPVGMAWEDWFEENAMTYDEFVAANGEYSLHMFGITNPAQ